MRLGKRYILRALLKLLVRARWYAPFIQILKSAISEHPDNRVIAGQERITVLALSPEGFRGDLEALAKSGECRVLIMGASWHYRLLYIFYREGLRARYYLNPEPGSAEMRSKDALQAFYRKVLPDVYQYHGIDCVISYHIRVPADVDWGVASCGMGFPYVTMYREGLLASSPSLIGIMTVLFERFGFWGTHLIVHNKSARQLCIDTALAPPEKVSALGCIRMDDFVNRIQETQAVRLERRKVTLFPISLKDGGKFDFSLLPFFNGHHVALAKLALKYPDIDFVFKPKPKVYPDWRKLVDKAFAEAGIDARKLPNLIMDPNLDAQKLILESSVVCGINSTTLLEAALAGKPVVVPYFERLRKQPYADYIRFTDAFRYLDVAADTESFTKLVEKRLEDPEISKEDMAGRRAIFKKYVSNPDGGALDKYIQLLGDLVIEARSRRSASLSELPDESGGVQPVGTSRIQRERHGTR